MLLPKILTGIIVNTTSYTRFAFSDFYFTGGGVIIFLGGGDFVFCEFLVYPIRILINALTLHFCHNLKINLSSI